MTNDRAPATGDDIAELRREFAEVRAMAIRLDNEAAQATNERDLLAQVLLGPILAEYEGGGRDRSQGLADRFARLEAGHQRIESKVTEIHSRATNGGPGLKAAVKLTTTERWSIFGIGLTFFAGMVATVVGVWT